VLLRAGQVPRAPVSPTRQNWGDAAARSRRLGCKGRFQQFSGAAMRRSPQRETLLRSPRPPARILSPARPQHPLATLWRQPCKLSARSIVPVSVLPRLACVRTVGPVDDRGTGIPGVSFGWSVACRPACRDARVVLKLTEPNLRTGGLPRYGLDPPSRRHSRR
jgi:hypothetical protein